MNLFTISKNDLIKRLKSLGCRIGMMVLATIVGFVIDNLGILNLSPAFVGVLGLILGEISKTINKNLTTLKGLAGQK